MKSTPCKNALELKRFLAAIPDSDLEGIGICIDETDIEDEDGVEVEFEAGGFHMMTILGNHS